MNTPNDSARRAGRLRIGTVRLLLAVLGAAALFMGLAQGDYRLTLNKAVHLCMECIGIG